jgi:tetratricopeptide (TPR) repeat protein
VCKTSDQSLISDRTIRVFVSSTFRDMQAERDYLVKFTFPQLRKLCESRGVTWGEVDLRWGITDEEKAEGKVLSLCLGEIRRCRPYFIGLLGERYGWIPEEIPNEIVEREAWLREHVSDRKSVTELEILHGVLNNPEMANHAFFYFRDPNYIDQLPNERRPDFVAEDDESAGKLSALKRRLRDGGFSVRENFADPKALGEIVLKDFTGLIDAKYPAGAEPDPVDREAADHEAFAQSRARVYIGRQQYFDRLDEQVRDDGSPLIVLGESGAGKSALLANWASRYREKHPDAFVIQHYIGATPYSADWVSMLRRIIAEFKRRFDIQQDIPDKPEELRATFVNWLYAAAAKERVVLILDALNQLEDRDGAPDLVWLPPVIPRNITLIVSTLPGRALDDLKKRDWASMEVKPLDPRERAKLLGKYLRQFTKRLNKSRRRRIVTAEQTANPLYLRALLDELRVFGVSEELDQRIEHYLAATTVEDLYEKILERYEQDYEGDRPNLVREAMSLLWAARRGLTENELLKWLGMMRSPLPRAFWSPLFLAAESSLIIRSGLICFGHAFLRTAVEHRYLNDDEKKQSAHLRLANYFSAEPLSLRRLDEQPWQDLQSEQWMNLRNTLTDLDLFEAAWDNDRRNEWIGYWTAISDKYDPEASYEAAVARYVQQHGLTIELARIMQFLGWMLHEMGLFEASLPFKQRALAIRERELPPDHTDIAASLNDLGEYFRVQRRHAEARPLFERSLAIFEKSAGPNSKLLARSLNNLAVLCTDEGDFQFALVLWQRALGIAEVTLPIGDPQRIAGLINLADLYRRIGDDKSARGYAGRALESSERFLGQDHPTTAHCLDVMGSLLAGEGNEAEAARRYEKALAIRKKIFGENHPNVAICLHNLAALANEQGKYDEARELYQRAFKIFEKVYGADHVRLTECLLSLAENYQEQGKYSEAIELAERVLRVRERTLGAYHPDVAEAHNRLAELTALVGRFEEAMRHNRKALEIREQMHGPGDVSVAQSLNNLAELNRILGKYDEAVTLNQRALEIRQRVLGDDHIAVAQSLNNLGVTLYQKGEQRKALELSHQALRIKEKFYGAEHPEVANTLNNLGQILCVLGDTTSALEFHERALAIRTRRFGDEHVAVAESLNNLGMVLHERGDSARAMWQYEKALAIKEKLLGPDHPGLAGALNNVAILYFESGRRHDAAALFRRCLMISERAFGLAHPDTDRIRQNLRACEASN